MGVKCPAGYLAHSQGLFFLLVTWLPAQGHLFTGHSEAARSQGTLVKIAPLPKPEVTVHTCHPSYSGG